MKKKRFVDLLLIITGGAIALISYFYLDSYLRWWLVALGCGMILIFLILAIRERHAIPLQAGAPIFDMPPAAKVTEVLLLNEEEQEAVLKVRRALGGMKSEQALEQILNLFKRTKSNKEFIETVKKMHL